MKRNIISLLLFFGILVIITTGILMYFFPFHLTTVALHTFLGFFISFFIVLHFLKNKRALINYVKGPRKSKNKVSLYFLLSFFLISTIVIGSYLNWKPFVKIYQWGEELRQNKTSENISILEYEVIQLNPKINGKNISVEVTKDAKKHWSVMAIWVEDEQGNFVQTLYVTQNIATGTFWGIKDGEEVRIPIRRPEAIPYWAHKRGITEHDGYKVPTPETKIVDAISGATPPSHYIVNTKLKENTGKFRVLYEINKSFDWNEYYHENAFPNDPIYSGNGYVGQPSLVYSTDLIDIEDSSRKSYLMKVIGHGHHSGKDGKLYKDVSNITTALDLTKRCLVILE